MASTNRILKPIDTICECPDDLCDNPIVIVPVIKGMNMEKKTKSKADELVALTVHREHCAQLEKVISGATDPAEKTQLKVLLNHERQLLNSSQKRHDEYRA